LKISIITPCFNAAQYIEQTILSIINQDYDNVEYIIIDGGSTDGTVDIIKKYDDKISYWISEHDKGQSDAINKGIAVATGDVFNWINADDYLEDGVLKQVANHFENESLNVLCCRTTFIRPDGSTYINRAKPFEDGLFKMLNSRGLNQMGMFWRLNKVKQLKGVNTDFQYAMDLDLWKRYLLTFGIEGIIKDDVLVGCFRLLETSKTGIDMAVNASFFDEENNAALIHYAKEAGDNYVKCIQFLYPIFKRTLAEKHVHSPISKVNVNSWLKVLFYEKAKRYFYANDYKNTYSFIKFMPLKEYSGEELKNLKSFKRWSSIKRWF
jgi:glycosyltransferase involved in cell wall biosynthesis